MKIVDSIDNVKLLVAVCKVQWCQDPLFKLSNKRKRVEHWAWLAQHLSVYHFYRCIFHSFILSVAVFWLLLCHVTVLVFISYIWHLIKISLQWGHWCCCSCYCKPILNWCLEACHRYQLVPMDRQWKGLHSLQLNRAFVLLLFRN